MYRVIKVVKSRESREKYSTVVIFQTHDENIALDRCEAVSQEDRQHRYFVLSTDPLDYQY